VRKYATTIVLFFSLLIGEIHTFWEKRSQEPIDLIWASDIFMSRQWYAKLIGLQINYTLYFFALYLYGGYSNRVNRSSAVAFILFSLVDTLMFFYNYKTYGYGLAYFILLILWISAYLWQTPRRK
jgi:hypothetical protein